MEIPEAGRAPPLEGPSGFNQQVPPEEEKKSSLKALQSGPLDLPPQDERPLRGGLIRKPEDLAQENEEEDQGLDRQIMPRKPQSLTSLQKPYYYSFEQREIDETQYLTHIVTGGFLGTGSAKLKKTGILTPQAEAYFRRHQVDKMREDGLYVGGAHKMSNPSVNRLEQRLLREGSHSYFKANGELKLHTELLAGSMTHPTDFSTEVSKSYSVRVVNALLSERLHQYKNHYYRMDIAIGRLQFTDHPFFSKEQRLCTMMREAVKDFDQRSNRRVIPFLLQRAAVLQDEMQSKQNDPSTAKSQIQFVKVSLEEVQKRLEQQKRQIKQLAEGIMQLWNQVKIIRQTNNNFIGDPVRLRVRDFVTQAVANFREDNLVEYEFKLKPQQSADNIPVPRTEKDRRRKLESQRVALVLIVNDQEVARTKNQKLSQNFEADFDQIFQLKLYSMPTSIKLKLLMGGRFKTELATIGVPIPGEHVYAMTSAAALTRELLFQADAAMGRRFQWVDEREKPKPQKKDSERERMNQAAEDEEEQQIIQDQNYLRDLRRTRGSIIIKAGWVGKGPKMPPTKIENLFSKTVSQSKSKGGYEALPQDDTEEVVQDINDPLNLELVKRLKDSKNRELKQMLEKDALNPLAEVDPLRHKLLRAQELYPQLHKLEIPLDDRDILRNQSLMSFVRMIVEDQQEYRGLEERDSEPGGVDQAMKDAFARNKEAHQRRREFEEKLLKRQKQIKIQGGNVYGLTPKAIIKEYEFGPQQTCFTSCLKALFKERGRNLRPHREEIKPLSAANHQKCDISVHIIKGNSLPIREKFLGLQTQLDNMRARAKKAAPLRGRFDSRGQPGYPQQQAFQQARGFPGFQGQPQPQQGFGAGQAPGFLGSQDPYNRGIQQQNFGGEAPGGPGMGGPSGNFGFNQGGRAGFMDSRFSQNQGIDPGAGGYLGGSAASGVPLGTIFDIVSQMERVRTIVEVRLTQIGKKGVREERTVYTSNTEGPNPDWNEIVHIPYTLLSEQNFTMQQLLQEQAVLYLNIFDVIKELKKQSYGQVLYTWEKRFLGMVEIPLMTVFQNKGKMDAILRVRRPLLMFDYQTTSQSLVSEGVPRPQQQQVVEGEAPSYMTVSIRLQPAIELPSENQFEHRSGLEDGQLISRGVRWLKSWRKKAKYRERVIKVFAQNVEGRSIYLPRFLSPQKPPLDFYEENADDPYAIERVIRYVSLIPFADDNRAFQDMPDIFCTSQQFLDFGSGDYEEHAILLCNYFNYIDQGKRNIKSYLVFGMGFPQGYTSYVLRRNINSNSVQLWNAVTGEGYYFPAFEKPRCCSCWALFGTRYTKPYQDPKCPLKEIGCIVSEDNIYVNLQDNTDPAGMSFNLQNKKYWKPFLTPKAFQNFFGPGGAGRVRTVNPENLDYTDLETHLRQQLEEEVELYIAQMFENERATFREDRRPLRTLWRNDLRDRLRAVLVQLEQFKFKMRNGATDSDMIHPQAREEEKKAALLSRLKDDVKGAIGAGREVFGFPLNKSYTKKEKMWEEVRNTDIHNVPDEEAEFALACAVFNYPCTVYSVWIYICCIQREKN